MSGRTACRQVGGPGRQGPQAHAGGPQGCWQSPDRDRSCDLALTNPARPGIKLCMPARWLEVTISDSRSMRCEAPGWVRAVRKPPFRALGRRPCNLGGKTPCRSALGAPLILPPSLLFPAPPPLWRPAPTQPNCPPELLITEPSRSRDLLSHHFSRATQEVATPLSTIAK